jgi:DNA-binding SARP family transcriptional activator
MDRSSPGVDGHPSPEIAAVLQAIDALQQQLLAPSAPAAIAPALSTYPAEALHSAKDTCPHRFEAFFFGGFALRRDDRPVELGQQWSSLELCRYLIAQRGRLVPRDELLEVLWPDAPASSCGLHRLHVAVSALRRLVDPGGTPRGFVRLEGECYAVSTDVVATDFGRFDMAYAEAMRALTRGEHAIAAAAFRAAIALYRGDFLADHPYAEWTQLPRDHFRERRLTALAILCECAARDHDRRSVIELATEILATDNLRESAHRHLMRARYHSGERGLAIRQFETCARLLRGELGVDPSPHTRRLHEAIRDDRELPLEPSLLS